MTEDIRIANLQSQYKETKHILHFILTILFVPWVVVWIGCGVMNSLHNQEIDIKIENIGHEKNRW